MQALVEDILDNIAIGGIVTGVTSALFAGRNVVWMQGLLAGQLSYALSIASYFLTLQLVDTFAMEFFADWGGLFAIGVSLSSQYLVSLICNVSFEVLLVANIVGVCSYYFFSEKVYS